MDPSILQNQEMGLESMLGGCPKAHQGDKKPKPQPEQALNCPRCDSTNTKFCYYNNYSLSQPRYFCKSCRRYWTKGGTLRNVPVGGGCRKNKRSTSSSRRSQDQQQQPLSINNTTTSFSYDSSNIDLSLAFARLQNKNQVFLPPDHNPFESYESQFGVFNPHHHLAYNANSMNNSAYFGSDNNHLYNFGEGSTTVKQEYLEGISNDAARRKEESENSSLGMWGSSLPWQNMSSNVFGGGEDDGINVEGRQSWNGIGSSSSTPSWHGLINTTLI